MGHAGLFGMAFLDSAGLPTGGAPDLVLLLLAMRVAGAGDVLLLVLVAVVGSTLGCLFFYYLGTRGGRPILAHLSAEKQTSIKAKIDRHGFLTILLAMLGPPPYPMKLFVISAGVFRMRLLPFVASVLLGRAVRYSAVGYLSIRFGEQAAHHFKENYPVIFFTVLGVVGAGLLVRWCWKTTAG